MSFQEFLGEGGGDPEESKGFSIWPGGSFSAFLKTLTTRQLALWLFLASLIGGGIAALVITFAFPALTVLGIPSILGLTGIAVPLILASAVGALVTLATLMILERYISDKATSPALFVVLVSLAGIAFATLGLFIVATTPGLLGALTFGLGPAVPFVIAGVGLGVLAMVGAAIAYTAIDRRAGAGGPSAELATPKAKKIGEQAAVAEILSEVRGMCPDSLNQQLERVETGLKQYPDNKDLLHKRAVLLCFRGVDGDYANASGIFHYLALPSRPSRFFSRLSDMNKMAEFGLGIADKLFNAIGGRGLEEDRKATAYGLMQQFEKELKKPSFGKGEDKEEARQDVLKLCVIAAQEIDPDKAENKKKCYEHALQNISNATSGPDISLEVELYPRGTAEMPVGGNHTPPALRATSHTSGEMKVLSECAKGYRER